MRGRNPPFTLERNAHRQLPGQAISYRGQLGEWGGGVCSRALGVTSAASFFRSPQGLIHLLQVKLPSRRVLGKPDSIVASTGQSGA